MSKTKIPQGLDAISQAFALIEKKETLARRELVRLAPGPAPRAKDFALRPVAHPWRLPVREDLSGFRRSAYHGVPAFISDGLSRQAAAALRRRSPGLSLVFGYRLVGGAVVALLWHPRYEVVVAEGGRVMRSIGINPYHDALQTATDVQRRVAGNMAEQQDYALALAVFDRTVAELGDHARPLRKAGA